MLHEESDLDRLAHVNSRMRQASLDCGRDPADTTLVCVTKTVAGARIGRIIDAGCRRFGD